MPQDSENLVQKCWLILKRHWLPSTLVGGGVVAIAIWIAFSTEEIYQAYSKLRFKKNTAPTLTAEAGEESGIDSLSSENTPLDTEAEVIRSYSIISQTIEALALRDQEGNPKSYEEIRDRLEVESLADTDVLRISYQSRDPQEAKAVVDQIVESYLENNLLTNRTEAVAAREFITEQLPKTEASLKQAEGALRSFKEEYHIVDLTEESQLLVGQISELDNKITQTRAAKEKIASRIASLEKKLGVSAEEALALSTVNDSATVQQVLTQLQEVKTQLAIAQSRYTEENPTVINLTSQKNNLEALLEQEVKQIVGQQSLSKQSFHFGDIQKNLAETLILSEIEDQELLEELNYLKQAKAAYTQRANLLPQLEQQQRSLERQLNVAQSSYNVLSDKLQQVQLAENQSVGNAQVLNPAIVAKSPASPSRNLIVAAGVGAGSILFVITAFTLEALDPSVKTSKELRKILNMTLLGMIPMTKKGGLPGMKAEQIPEHQVINAPHSLVSEAYNMLQANLKFLSPDQDLKAIVVTSAVSKEGKSTVSANLAAAIAQLGKRVLLIDADLHHPRQHQIWDLTNEVGLSEAIADQVDWEQNINSVLPNLDVLCAGATPHNSLALLESERMSRLMEEFRHYDCVIIDTPPLLLLADALTIGKLADGVLLVARPGVVDRVSTKATRELLMKSGHRILGLVTNGVVPENEPDSYFHYVKSYHEDDSNIYKLLHAKVEEKPGVKGKGEGHS